jgi:hypothetical protein
VPKTLFSELAPSKFLRRIGPCKISKVSPWTKKSNLLKFITLPSITTFCNCSHELRLSLCMCITVKNWDIWSQSFDCWIYNYNASAVVN